MSSCVLKPYAGKNEHYGESKLFNELTSHYSREQATDLYALSGLQEIRNLKGIDLNEQGEPTFSSLYTVLNLAKSYAPITEVEESKEGVRNEEGRIVFNAFHEAEAKAIKIMQNNQNNVATVQKVLGGYEVAITRSPNNSEDLQRRLYNQELNTFIREHLKRLGFEVGETTDTTIDGVFDMNNAEKTAEGLITAIKIANSELGEEALPEEYAHLILRGLAHTPLVKRIFDQLKNKEVLKEVLGEEYESYAKRYDEDSEALAEEAAGKLFKQVLMGNTNTASSLSSTTLPVKGLLRRLWDFAKGLFRRSNSNYVQDVVTNLKKEMLTIKDNLVKGKLDSVLNFTPTPDSRVLYKIKKEAMSLKNLVEDSIRALEKQKSFYARRAKDSSKQEAQRIEDAIKNIHNVYKQANYVKSLVNFTDEVLVELDTITKNLAILRETFNERYDKQTSLEDKIKWLNHLATASMAISDFTNIYAPILNVLNDLVRLANEGDIDISVEDAQKIQDLAQKIIPIIERVNTNKRELDFDLTYRYVSLFWSDKIKGKEGMEDTLKYALTTADRDIGTVDRYLSSLASSNDIMSSVVSKIFKYHQNRRDTQLRRTLSVIRTIHASLKMSGNEDTSFMFEKDDKGVPTGRYLSNVDYDKFYKARKEEYERLKAKYTDKKGTVDYAAIRRKMNQWENNNMETVVTKSKTFGTEIIYKIPKKSLYYSGNLDKANLSAKQREYYDNMLELKAILSTFLPNGGEYSFHKVIMKRKDSLEALTDESGNKLRAIFEDMKSSYIRREDDTDFGEMDAMDDIEDPLHELHKEVKLNAKGEVVRGVPVFYTRRLSDMATLSQDVTSTMISFAAMATNYAEMSTTSSNLELLLQTMRDRDVLQHSGDAKLVESVKGRLGLNTSEVVKKGGKIVERIEDFYESQLYGINKLDNGTFELFGNHIDVAKSLDSLRNLTSHIALDLNILSATSNVVVGKIQMFLEQMAGEYYTFRDGAKADAEYFKMLPSYMAELNAPTKTNKLALLFELLDPTGEFFSQAGETRIRRGLGTRIVGNTSLLFMQSAGEHYLAGKTMLAMLNNKKLIDKNGSKITLLEAFEEVKSEVNGKVVDVQLQLKEGLKNEQGEAFTEDDLFKYKIKIKRVSQSLNGAFNDADKGAIHRHAVGRLAMQFRQWMVEHFERRIMNNHFDAEMDQYREGYYRTAGRFLKDAVVALREHRIDMATQWDNLSDHQKANMKRAGTELTLLAIMYTLYGLLGDIKKTKNQWLLRFLQYQLMRTKMELSASTPTPGMLGDLLKLAKSPAASTRTLEGVVGLLFLNELGTTIQSGKYRGHSRYYKNAMEIMPLKRVWNRTSTLDTEDDAFVFLR